MSHIADRLSLNMLSEPERQFLADYLLGKIKPRKLKATSRRSTRLRFAGRHFLRAKDWKHEAAVKKVCRSFHVKRSYVFQLLKGIDYPKKIAARKAQCPQLA